MHYKRNLSQLKGIPKNWYKVFSCFSCGGGSSMWYKYAGYDVIGTCEIDKEMNLVYQTNFWQSHNFEMWVGDMAALPNESIPQELFNIDILDWSPPCSTFSTLWLREKARGKEKLFREWQAKQVLDDLFFQFLDVAEKLQPKMIIAENVSWMLKGNAKWYVKMIAQRLDDMWYTCQLFLLNWSTMWLPQKRERVFFMSSRKDLNLPKISLQFNEREIFYKEICTGKLWKALTEETKKVWMQRRAWDCSLSNIHERISGKAKRFNAVFVHHNKTPNTLVAWSDSTPIKFDRPYRIPDDEICMIGSYPLDYNFLHIKPQYLIGMSVPPLMMFKVSEQVKLQRLDLLLK